MTTYSSIQSSRLYERIVAQIERRILNGELRQGDQLPTERELTEQFGVSRTAVREAMQSLLEMGLVEVYHGRGAFVSNGTSRAVKDSLSRMVKFGGEERYQYLIEVRAVLEPEIASLAALRATDEHLQAMRESVEAMQAALDDPGRYVEADLDFHLTLAEASGNPIFPAIIDSIVDLLRDHRIRFFTVPRAPERSQIHHRHILKAIVRRDPQAAREAMQAHVQQIGEDTRLAIGQLAP